MRIYLMVFLFFVVSCKTNLDDLEANDKALDSNKKSALQRGSTTISENQNLAKEEIDEKILGLISQTKEEMVVISDNLHAGPRKDKKDLKSLISNARSKSDQEVFNYITSKEYQEYRKSLDEASSNINVVEKGESLGLTSEENERGFFLTDKEERSAKKRKANDEGATWLIVAGSLNILTGNIFGIGTLVVGGLLKDDKQKNNKDLITAGKVLNIIGGSTALIVGSGIGIAALVTPNSALKKSGGKSGTAFIGIATMAIGIAQIIAGSEMGLAQNTSIKDKALKNIGNLSFEIHELLELRANLAM